MKESVAKIMMAMLITTTMIMLISTIIYYYLVSRVQRKSVLASMYSPKSHFNFFLMSKIDYSSVI